MIEIINFRASTIEPNPKEVTYWVDLNEDPLGGIIKSWDGEGHWRTLRILEGSIVKVEERIHEWVTLKLAELTEWVEGTVKDMTDLVHTWDGRITLVEDKVAKFEELKQDKLIPGFGISIDSNNIISSTVDLSLYRVVPELPTEYIDDTKIYIVFDPDGEGTNTHKEYVYLNGEWELLGEYADYASRTEFLLEVEDRKSADNKLTEDLNTVDNKAKLLELWKSKIVPYKLLHRVSTEYLSLNNIGHLLLEFNTIPVNGDDPMITSSIPLPQATSNRNGLMSNTDKIKLDTTIPNLITDETNARTAADTTITNNLNKEILDRKDVVSEITTTLNNEIQERKDADTILNSLIGSVSNETNAKIDAEITRSTNKDIAHELSIANEITRAKAAEKVNTDAITEEVTRSKAAEVTLQTNLNTTNTNLSNEITRAKAAEKTNADNLAAEIERSTNKDTALQTSITTETTRATNAETALETRTTTLESDNTTNKSNISTLQSNLSPIKTAWDKRGTKDGLLTLGDGGLISSQHLPSYVDDVIDAYATYDVSPTNQISNIKLYSNAAHTTAIVGESGKSYNDVTNGHPGYQFRWSGTAWVLITSGGLIIGNITGTAYDGGRGKLVSDTVQSLPNDIITGISSPDILNNTVRLGFYSAIKSADGLYGAPADNKSITLPSATPTKAGIMTAADKTKLDNATSGLTASTLMMRDVNGDANVRYLYNDSIIDNTNPVDYVNFMTGSNRIIRKCTLSRLRDNISDISLRSGWLQRNATLLYGTGGLQFFDIDGIAGTDPAANVTPTTDWYYIIRTNHANAGGYFHDIAIPFTNNGSMLRRNVIKGVNYGWYTILDSYNWNNIVKYEQLSDKLNVSVDSTPNSIVKRSVNGFILGGNTGVTFTDTAKNSDAKSAWTITTEEMYGGTTNDLKIKQYIGTKGNLILNGVPVATAGNRYILTLYNINTSGLDENTYYPVTIPLYSGGNFRIEVLTSLNNTVPSWSSHVSGFTVRFIEEVQGNGWGATPLRRRILDSAYNYVRDEYPPIGKVAQMTNSSTEVIWIRGGGLYHFYTSGTNSVLITPVLRTSSYTADEQTVAPIPVADNNDSVVRNVLMYDDAVYEPTFNTVVRRNGFGYVNSVRFHTTTPVENYEVTHAAFFNNDGYIRKTTIDNFNKHLMFVKLQTITSSNEFNVVPSTYSAASLWLNYRGFNKGSNIPEKTATQIVDVYIGDGQQNTTYVIAKGYKKTGSSNSYALTGAGGHMIITQDSTPSSLAQRDSGGSMTAYAYFFAGSNSKVSSNCIELYSPETPYIDFHYQNSTADYTSRIIESGSGHLNILADNGITVTGSIVSNIGFYKAGSNNNYVLLGGGGHKLVSDFVDINSSQVINGHKEFYSTDASGSYTSRAIELREVNKVEGTTSDPKYSPAIGFHWAGQNASVISMHKDGNFYFTGSNSSSTTYRNIYCSDIIADNYTLSTSADSNPYLRLNSGSQNYFVQSYNNLLYLGATLNNGNYLCIDATGNAGLGVLPNSIYKLYVNGNIRSSQTINAGEDVDMGYGYINVSRPGTIDNAACFSWVRDGIKPFALGFNHSNQIVLGQGKNDRTIIPWLTIGEASSSSTINSHLNTQTVSTEDGYFNHDLCRLNKVESVTGTICITLPVGWTSSMNMYEFYVYEYSNVGGSRVLISGYNYDNVDWVNYVYNVDGNFNRQVRLGYKNGKCCILLGTKTSEWNYPQVYLANVYSGFHSVTSWKNGYAISVLTDESSITNIVTVPKSYFHSSGFMKDGSSDSYVLLGGGGHKLISEISGGGANSVAWANVTAKPTTISGYGITDAVSTSDSRLTNSRPASDVSAWAKASTKPSYSWSEITSKPNLNYLPLSGGTMTNHISFTNGKGIIITNAQSGGSSAGIYYKKGGTDIAGIGVLTSSGDFERAYLGWGATPWNSSTNLSVSNGSFSYKNYTVYHSGNLNVNNYLLKTGDVMTGGLKTQYVLHANTSTAGVIINKPGVSYVGFGGDGNTDKIFISSCDAEGNWTSGYTNISFDIKMGSLTWNGNTLARLIDLTWGNITGKPSFASVATSGNYNDLSNRPTIPSAYTLPASTASVLGGIKVGYATSGKNYKVQVDSSNNAYVNVPWTDTNTTYGLATTSANGLLRQLNGSTALYMRGDGTWATPPNTTYSAATSSAAGLMSAADKAKLDGVASGANAYSLPTSTASVLGGVKIGSGLGINSSGLAYVSYAPLVQNSLTIKNGSTTTTWNGGAPITIDITKPAGVETIDKVYNLNYMSGLGNSSRVAFGIPSDYPYGKRAKLSVRFSGRKTSGSGLAYDVDYKDIVILTGAFDDYRGMTVTALSTDYTDVSLVAISSLGYNVSPNSALLYFLSMNGIFAVVSEISATLSPI